MTSTGRLTADATVATMKDERKVVNFSVAINDSYKPKGGERVKLTTYCNCSYWTSEKVAPYLTKGMLLELDGRVYVTPYVSRAGEAKVSLNCHVSNIRFLAKPKEAEVIGRPVGRTGTAAVPPAGYKLKLGNLSWRTASITTNNQENIVSFQ